MSRLNDYLEKVTDEVPAGQSKLEQKIIKSGEKDLAVISDQLLAYYKNPDDADTRAEMLIKKMGNKK